MRILQTNEDNTADIFLSPDCQQLLTMYDSFYSEKGFVLPWVGYLVLDDDKIMGTCGFTGKPDQGKVEIAYWTFSEFEGRGVASFACQGLVNIAIKSDPTVIITAKTAPEHNASTHILQKNGFAFQKIVQDHEIGDAWLWKHEKHNGI